MTQHSLAMVFSNIFGKGKGAVMKWRWLRSCWFWLGVSVIVGALLFTIPALQSLRLAMDVADAFSSGIKDGLREIGFNDSAAKASQQMSISFLFGLVQINDTVHPYLWSTVGGIVTGGGLGVVVWAFFELVLVARCRIRNRL
ncbi:hypothetical protein ACXR0O_15520 [Verrucomicrobiota bacterium sgz303538]